MVRKAGGGSPVSIRFLAASCDSGSGRAQYRWRSRVRAVAVGVGQCVLCPMVVVRAGRADVAGRARSVEDGASARAAMAASSFRLEVGAPRHCADDDAEPRVSEIGRTLRIRRHPYYATCVKHCAEKLK